MGRSDVKESSRIKSPVKRYIKFGGESGVFSYWDGEKNVTMDKLDMVVLDVRSSVSGWSDSIGARIFSNYFRSVSDVVNVRAGDKDILSGAYSEKKGDIENAGGKFQSNVFALVDIDGEWVPSVLQLTGSGLGSWIKFVDENKMFSIYKSLVSVTCGDKQKKGRVEFFSPVFTLEPLPDKLSEQANDFHRSSLKPYLEQGSHKEEVAV